MMIDFDKVAEEWRKGGQDEGKVMGWEEFCGWMEKHRDEVTAGPEEEAADGVRPQA